MADLAAHLAFLATDLASAFPAAAATHREFVSFEEDPRSPMAGYMESGQQRPQRTSRDGATWLPGPHGRRPIPSRRLARDFSLSATVAL